MKVLITGAAGRVGANVVSRLENSGAEIRALVLPGDRHMGKLTALPAIEIVEGDLCDQDAVTAACRGVTHVVHLAAQMVRGDTPVDRYYDVNAFSTLRLLEGVLSSGQQLERFVLASTDSTYRPADPPATPLTEDVKQEPADYYGTSKLLGEIILRNRAAQFELPYSIVRFGSVLSPEEAHQIYTVGFLRGWVQTQQKSGRQGTMWPLFSRHPGVADQVNAATENVPLDNAMGFIGPEGPWTLSSVDVRDAAQGVCLALTEPGAIGQTFNIAAANATTAEEGASVVSDVLGVPKILVAMPMTWRMELSIQAAQRAIGYQPRYDYRATVTSGKGVATEADSFIPASEGNDGILGQLSGKTTSLA